MAASDVDWMGLLNTGLNLYGALNSSSKNRTAAQNYGNFTQYNPYNVATPSGAVGFSGNNVMATLNPQYQAIQNSLMGGAGGLLGGMPSLFGSGGINPYLNNAMSAYDTAAPQNTVNGIDTGGTLAPQFNSAAKGFLGGLGSFDYNQLSSDYTNNLRSQAAPGQQKAAESLAQRLYNTGRLGTTGGAGMMGEMINQQNQQDLQFQLAGRDYAGAEQNRLAGLASGFGQMGDQLFNSQFGRRMTKASEQFNQNNMRAQQRFMNAMNLFGAGQQNMTSQLQGGLGMLQGAQGLDQNLMQMIGLGGTLGAQRSQLNQAAYAPGLDASVAKNNTNAAALINGIGGLMDSGAIDFLGGMFGNGGVNSGWGSGQLLNDAFGEEWKGTQPINGSSFNAAGGEAAGLLGNVGNFSNWQNMSDQQLAQTLGSDPRIFDPSTFGGGQGFNSLGGLLSGANSALGVYGGLQQGDVGGYVQAAQGLSNLASQAGISGAEGISSALGNVASLYGVYNVLKGGQGKFGGALSGAGAGFGLGGPIGAIIGGVAGYLREGGFKDTNPWEASGFGGKTMEEALKDQDLARLISNPVGSLGALFGVDSKSTLGKILDPAGMLNSNYKEEGIRDEYYNNPMSFTDPKNFYQAVAGEFRGSRSAFPPRASGKYGKKDEDVFIKDMATRINQAYNSGTIKQGDNAQTILDKVVTPWFEEDMGGWGKNIPKEWVSDQKMMTLDLINRYINGQPVEWAVIAGGSRDNAVPQYAGLYNTQARPVK